MTPSASPPTASREGAVVTPPPTAVDRCWVIAEWVLVAGTLFVLGRSPVLFLRQRLLDEIGGPIAPIWQDDALIRSVFLLPAMAVCALAARHWDSRNVVRHILLVALLAFAVASTVWSVEPGVTQLRALMFLTTTGVGWYLGTRFALAAQLDAVICAGAIGVGSSLTALAKWPELAKSTNGVLGEWSGVYVNRNLLALAVCITILAVILRWPSASARYRLALATLLVPAAWLVWRSGARTGPVALVSALVVITIAIAVRSVLVRRGAPMVLCAAAMLIAAVGAVWVADRVQDEVFDLLDRSPTLTRRTEMWDIDRTLIDVHPWRGWGFEAAWSHQPVIDFAAPRFHAYPYQAHNGYFEMALSLGRIGLFLLLALIVVTFVRGVGLVWGRPGAAAMWPLGITTYALVANVSESLFVANEALWALFVSAGVAAVAARQDPKVTPVPGASGSPGSPAARLPRSGPR